MRQSEVMFRVNKKGKDEAFRIITKRSGKKVEAYAEGVSVLDAAYRLRQLLHVPEPRRADETSYKIWKPKTEPSTFVCCPTTTL